MAESKSESTKTTSKAPESTEPPGPISPEHESGSAAQTAKVNEAREALREAHKNTAKS